MGAFKVWACIDCNISEATETLIFGLDGRIIRHTFVYMWTEGQGPESAHVASGVELGKPVADAWDNHFNAFGGQNVTKIMKDYDDSSEVYVFDHSSGNLDTYTGTTEIRSLFEALFISLPDPTDVGAPVQIVEEKETAPYVLLVWKSPRNGYARATDTFVFNNADTAMIKRQFVVVYSNRVDSEQVANGHLNVVKAGNVADATKNYAEDARVEVYNQADGSHTTHTMTDITAFYTALFATGDLSTLVSKHMHFNGSTVDTFASAFMVWACIDCNIREATETLIFGLDGRIIRHTFVYMWTEGQGPESAHVASGVDLGKPVADAWDNHFSAFGDQDVTKIMKDYDDSSDVYVFDHSSGNLDTHTGTTEIQGLFEALFVSLPDPDNV